MNTLMLSGMLKSSAIIVLSDFPFLSVNICFEYLGAPTLGAYMLTNVIYSPLVLMLSLLNNAHSLSFVMELI